MSARDLARRAVHQPRLRWSLSLVGVLALVRFQTRFKRSFLGVLWLVVQPTLQAAVLVFVVVKVFRAATVDNYALYVLSGTVPWVFTVGGLTQATTSVVDSGSLIRKVRVPSLVYPASAVGGFLLAYSAPLAVVLVLATAAGTLSPASLLLPLVVALHALFILGFGTLAAAFYVTYRDVRNVIESGLGLAFFATPILYEIAQLPSWAAVVIRFNPMTGVMSLYRGVFLGRPVDGLAVAISCCVVATLLVVGSAVFRRRAGEFADLV